MSSRKSAANKTEKELKKVVKLEKRPARKPKSLGAVEPDEVVFALDIGTRTIVGIAGVEEEGGFRVVATEVKEHRSRAMLDGQIHDIDQVAQLAAEVKTKLEKQLGFELKRVAIAAAGRVLKTCEVKVERELEQGRHINQELVSSLEIEGIQKAQSILDEEASKEDKTQFYCVGYSVINYYLNGYVITKLAGHKGTKIGAYILATFLPHVVVDSLYTVMSRIGLEVTSLTLEPIAAINVTIPKDLRLLNLVLVDIGAGTSDIAITRDGSVVAYAMAPIAGDEITERLSQHYLVDFNTAEKMKISLSQGKEKLSYTDILGAKKTVDALEALEIIKPVVRQLAEIVCEKITDYNQRAPNAVFLIGGGSQTPGVTEAIAEILKLQPERVAVRKRDVIRNVKFNGKKLSGPEAITPYGIAITALMQRGNDFLSVTVNGIKVRLFNSKRLTVADALILAGFNPGQLIGRTGKSLNFELNGEKRFIRGEHGRVAEIFINGKQASLDSLLSAGDDITVEPAADGGNAEARIGDVIGEAGMIVIDLDGKSVRVGTRVFRNGVPADVTELISEGDSIAVERIDTVEALKKSFSKAQEAATVLVNGEAAEGGRLLKEGDTVEFRAAKAVTAKEAPGDAPEDIIEDTAGAHGADEIPEAVFGVIVNGSPVDLKAGKDKYIFVDIFNFIDFDITRPQGSIILRLNGRTAAFTDEIKPGDIIDIYWDKK